MKIHVVKAQVLTDDYQSQIGVVEREYSEEGDVLETYSATTHGRDIEELSQGGFNSLTSAGEWVESQS